MDMFVCFIIIVGCAWGLYVEGMFGAFVMFCNVLIAGLITFNFFEPLADSLDSAFKGTLAQPYADAFAMILIFPVVLGILRVVCSQIAPKEVDIHPMVNKIGGGLIGALTGYILAGIIFCLFQTLPWHRNFMYYEWKYEPGEAFRSLFPPDRVWLAMMHRASTHGFAAGDNSAFDNTGTYSLRYARYRRYDDRGEVMPYFGELDKDIGR